MFDKSYEKVTNLYNRHGAVLFTIGSIACTIAASYTAYIAGKKAQKNPEMTKKEKIFNVLIPAAFTAGAVVCDIMSESKNAQTISLLGAAYFSSEKNRKGLMDGIKDYIGEENMDHFKESLHPTPDISDDIPEGLDLFIDEKTGFKSYDTLENKMKQANDFRRYYFDNGGIASHGDWIRFAHFDENDRAWPASDDDYGQPCDKGTTIDDVGYNSYILTESGYESGWIDVEFIKCTNPTTGQAYYLVDIPTPASVMFGEF